MNIFLLDRDPVIAAQMQCDKHVIKMIVESAQMLSTAHHVQDGVQHQNAKGVLLKKWSAPNDVLYKCVHVNHPCTIWTREGYQNYMWHYTHFTALCDEYTYRYGKVHATDRLLRDVLKHSPERISPIPTVFRMAVGDHPWKGDQVSTYRSFYCTKRHRMDMIWTKRNTPEWYHELTS